MSVISQNIYLIDGRQKKINDTLSLFEMKKFTYKTDAVFTLC